ncbi:MAG: CBS domain-containing protein, partial [bacterium]|nr:CBS domain-containing protein [bacterium]
MKVEDVMRREVVTVNPETTLRSAARIIFSGQVGGLPVVDKKGRLAGIVVEKDILSLFFPSLPEYIEDPTHVKDFEPMEGKVTEILELPIKKFMSKNPLTINPQAPLLQAVSLMIANRVGRLPVVDSKKRLV